MSIIRIQKDKENPYVIINKKFLEDPTISLKLKGFLAYCLSKPDDWKFHVRQLAEVLKEGKDAIYGIIEEGIDNGYIEREQQKFNGKFTGVDYVIHETKIQKILPLRGFPDTGVPDTETATLLNNDSIPNNEENKEPPSSAKPPSCPQPEAVDVANFLLETIKKTKPDIKEPSMKTWILVIDRMLRLDKRSLETCYKVLKWLPSSEFWSKNILSADSFREKFDKLELSMEKNPQNKLSVDLELLEKLKSHPGLVSKGKIVVGKDYVDFVELRDSCFKVGEAGFKEKVLNSLRKIGVPVN